jgi:hypothetical protein
MNDLISSFPGGIYCRFLGKYLVVRPLLSASFTGSACDGLRWLAQNAGFATLHPAFLRESSCSSYEQLVWCAWSAFLTQVVCVTHNKPTFVLAKAFVSMDPKSKWILGSYSVLPIWFTQCGHVWFTHAMPFPCRSHAMPRICRSESDLSRPRQGRGMGTAWEVHGNGMVCVN